MAIAILTETAEELDTYAVTVSFFDEAGVAMTPNDGLTWTLTDLSGNVVNGLEDVAIAQASSITIVLSGDDLAMQSTERTKAYRVLHIAGTYDGDLGSDLAISKQIRFTIDGSIAGPHQV